MATKKTNAKSEKSYETSFTREEMLSIQEEAFYRALKRFEKDKIAKESKEIIPKKPKGKEPSILLALFIILNFPIVDFIQYCFFKNKKKAILDSPPELEAVSMKVIICLFFYLASIVGYGTLFYNVYFLISKVALHINTIKFTNLLPYIVAELDILINCIGGLGLGLIFNILAKSIYKMDDNNTLYAFAAALFAFLALFK